MSSAGIGRVSNLRRISSAVGGGWLARLLSDVRRSTSAQVRRICSSESGWPPGAMAPRPRCVATPRSVMAKRYASAHNIAETRAWGSRPRRRRDQLHVACVSKPVDHGWRALAQARLARWLQVTSEARMGSSPIMFLTNLIYALAGAAGLGGLRQGARRAHVGLGRAGGGRVRRALRVKVAPLGVSRAWVPRVAMGLGGATRGGGGSVVSVGDLQGTSRHKGVDLSFRFRTSSPLIQKRGSWGSWRVLNVLPHHL